MCKFDKKNWKFFFGFFGFLFLDFLVLDFLECQVDFFLLRATKQCIKKKRSDQMLYFDQTPESSRTQDMRILKRNNLQRFLKCRQSRQKSILHDEKQKNKEGKQRRQDWSDSCSEHTSSSTDNFSDDVNEEDWLGHEHDSEHDYEHDYEHGYTYNQLDDAIDYDDIEFEGAHENSYDECKEQVEFDEEFKEIFEEEFDEEDSFGEEEEDEDEDEYNLDLIEFELAQAEFLATLGKHSQYLEAYDQTLQQREEECNEEMGDEDGADEGVGH